MSRFSDFDQYIEKSMESWHCPGAAVAVIKGQNIIHKSAYGFRDVEKKIPMTEDSRFAMASVTKSITAMSLALLVDDGKLEWDKPVREYVPELVFDDDYVTKNITVRDMLSHRTGLPRHDLSAWRLDLPRSEYIKRMRHLKFSATFRERFQYNNLMYYVSPCIVEAICGVRWEEFVQTRVFDPLGMDASNFAPAPPRAGQVNALGYRVDRGDEGEAKALIPMPFGSYTELAPGAAGALFSTLSDLVSWLGVHVNAGRSGDKQLISPNNIEQMHSPHSIVPLDGMSKKLLGSTIVTYGMGWFIEPYRESTLIYHGGNLEGHSLIVGFVPQEKAGVVVLTNVAGLPLRDVLLYDGIDRALGVADRDWNTRFHRAYDPIIVATAKGKRTSAAERLEDAPKTHPLVSYTGTFAASGYPDFAVRLRNDELEACTMGSFDWSGLRHYHYDVFEWHLSDFNMWMKVSFITGDTGEIDEISIPIEPSVENVVFRRKPLVLAREIAAALEGDYDSPVDGIIYTVSMRDGKTFIAETGRPPEEIVPYVLTPGSVTFKKKRVRFDFERGGEAIMRLVIKAPGMTLEAPRIV